MPRGRGRAPNMNNNTRRQSSARGRGGTTRGRGNSNRGNGAPGRGRGYRSINHVVTRDLDSESPSDYMEAATPQDQSYETRQEEVFFEETQEN